MAAHWEADIATLQFLLLFIPSIKQPTSTISIGPSLPGPTVGLYGDLWKKYTGFTFGLNAKVVVGRGKEIKSTVLAIGHWLKQVRAMSRSCCYRECICFMTVGHWECSCEGSKATMPHTHSHLPQGLPTPTLRQWNSLRLGSCTDSCSHFPWPTSFLVYPGMASHLSLARELQVMRTTIWGVVSFHFGWDRFGEVSSNTACSRFLW